LVDTADQIMLAPRTPSRREFIPIGHLALEKKSDWDEKLGLPNSGVLWVTSLYVSWAIQAGGLGRSGMRQLERMAREEPLNAKLLVLSTIPGSFQKTEALIKILYTDRGIPVPHVRPLS
jgi:hypothetical protein